MHLIKPVPSLNREAAAAADSGGGSEFGLVLTRRTSAVTTPSKTSCSSEYSGLKSTAALISSTT
jgi:hypothetical protein